IIVGAARLFLGDTSSQALPDYTGIQNDESLTRGFLDSDGEAVAGWTDLGLTTGGVEVTYAPDFGEVEVDQYLDTAYMYKQRQTVTVGTTLAEATLENLIFAWGQNKDTTLLAPADVTDDLPGEEQRVIISGGALGDEPEERALAFIGKAPRTGTTRKERLYYLERVLSVESSAHSLSRSDATTIPVSLRCLPNSDDTSGTVEYGFIVQRTLTAATP